MQFKNLKIEKGKESKVRNHMQIDFRNELSQMTR